MSVVTMDTLRERAYTGTGWTRDGPSLAWDPRHPLCSGRVRRCQTAGWDGAMSSPTDELHITIGHSPASDGWGFVGTVRIADHECYRSLRVFTTPTEALEATQVVMGDVLGALLAGQEWRALSDQVGHTPTRTDLRLGLANALTMPPVVGRLGHVDDSLDHPDEAGDAGETHA